ncbi:MAG: VWA domain-containing protein, partial [Acidobacteriota bacterium]
MRSTPTVALLVTLLTWVWSSGVPASALAGELDDGREIALVIDTSRSMRGNDPGRYTLLIAQILGDLLADDDGLTVIRMAKKETGCDTGADPRLTRRLDPRDRISFERQLEPLLRFNTGTNFAAALRTAMSVLDRVPERRRLLLVIADSGGLGPCAKVFESELLALRARGVELAAIHLGKRSGAFDGHPAFAATRTAADSEELVATVAAIYQRFLGARRVQTG